MSKRILGVLLVLSSTIATYAQHYNNFKVSVYCRAYETSKMVDTVNYLRPLWEEITRQLKVDKVYIETHRDLIIVDQKVIDAAKKFLPTEALK